MSEPETGPEESRPTGDPAAPADAPSAPWTPWTAWAAPYGSTPPGAAPPPPPSSLPPAWGPPPPPWASTWQGPTWQTLPPVAAPPPRRAGVGVAVTVVAALVAGLLGAAVGNRLARGTSSNSPAAAGVVVPSSPDNGNSSNGTNDPQVTPATDNVIRSVVDINTRLSYQGAQAAGTGLVLTPSGDILTNNHVVDGATAISVTIVDTGRTFPAKVVGTDPTADIAVIHLQGASGLHAINANPTPTVNVGDQVVAIGNAGGVGGRPSVVSGIVSATNQTITASDQNGANAERLSGLIQTNAPIQPGDSGGPLVNQAGDVIGINTAASSRNRFDATAAVGFAIPIQQAVSIAHQIQAGTASSTVHIGLPAFLGVSIDTSTGAAVIAGVESGSPAAVLGLQSGDTITSVDGKKVVTPDNLTTLLRLHHPGEKATIGWTDTNGAHHTGTATLIPGPAD